MQEIPQSALEPRLQKLAENARIALERGNAEYAISLSSEVLAASPACLPVRRLLRAAQLKHFQSKNKLFAKALGGVTSAGFLLTNSTLAKKNPEAALEAGEKMLAADPTNVSAYRLIAQAATSLGLYETAVFACESVVENSPNSFDALLELGQALLGAGQADKAIEIGNRMLTLKPNDGIALDFMKNASVATSLKRGRWEEAGDYRDKLKNAAEAVSLEQASKVVTSEEMTARLIQEAYERHLQEPENLNHYRSIIDGYRKMRDYEESLAWLEKARLLPAGAADASLAKLEGDLRLAGLEQGISAREEALETQPGDKALEKELHDLRQELARHRLDEAKTLVERYPNESQYRFNYGRLLCDLGDYDTAIAQLQLAARSPKYRIQALSQLGTCFMEKAQVDLAIEQLRTAKDELAILDDTKKDVIYRLGLAFERHNEQDKAVAEWKIIYAQDIGYRDVAARIDAFYKARAEAK